MASPKPKLAKVVSLPAKVTSAKKPVVSKISAEKAQLKSRSNQSLADQKPEGKKTTIKPALKAPIKDTTSSSTSPRRIPSKSSVQLVASPTSKSTEKLLPVKSRTLIKSTPSASKTSSEDVFEKYGFPVEIILEICCHLELPQIGRLSCVDRRFRSILSMDSFWKNLYLSISRPKTLQVENQVEN
eukprot:TRINITY_DN19587_c0_g1_i1.p1 TRINITY_DN19587_c0_g1~~TRINITY_DN19587_c0_g1_i1.p1  ORF type:complete len:185 (-),score=43.10 TRINITY_DN19587_c0_g1_i1:2-556(-)